VRDFAGGPPRAFTPEGVFIGRVSPDGKFVAAIGPSGRWVLFPVDGGEPRSLPTVEPDDVILRFDATGTGLFVAAQGFPARIDRLDLATGKRTFWREIALADPTGVGEIRGTQLTPDGRSYCYDFMRAISQLYVVDGLR
jgi:hypothetical protein